MTTPYSKMFNLGYFGVFLGIGARKFWMKKFWNFTEGTSATGGKIYFRMLNFALRGAHFSLKKSWYTCISYIFELGPKVHQMSANLEIHPGTRVLHLSANLERHPGTTVVRTCLSNVRQPRETTRNHSCPPLSEHARLMSANLETPINQSCPHLSTLVRQMSTNLDRHPRTRVFRTPVRGNLTPWIFRVAN